jgi:hypothetical protein
MYPTRPRRLALPLPGGATLALEAVAGTVYLVAREQDRPRD